MIIRLRDGAEITCKDVILDNKDILADGHYLIPLPSAHAGGFFYVPIDI